MKDQGSDWWSNTVTMIPYCWNIGAVGIKTVRSGNIYGMKTSDVVITSYFHIPSLLLQRYVSRSMWFVLNTNEVFCELWGTFAKSSLFSQAPKFPLVSQLFLNSGIYFANIMKELRNFGKFRKYSQFFVFFLIFRNHPNYS
jgi:hypothetical protein